MRECYLCNGTPSICITQGVAEGELPGVLTSLFTDHVAIFEVLIGFLLEELFVFLFYLFSTKRNVSIFMMAGA